MAWPHSEECKQPCTTAHVMKASLVHTTRGTVSQTQFHYALIGVNLNFRWLELMYTGATSYDQARLGTPSSCTFYTHDKPTIKKFP